VRLRRIHGWLVVALLFALAVALETHSPATPRGPRALLGPVAGLWSRVLWIRFQRAELAGEEARALDLAETALDYTPRDTEGWERLVSHLGTFLASAERTPDVELRRAYFRAALSTARRGAEVADEPGRLHWLRGMLALAKVELDPAIDPRGASGLLADAAAAFGEARAAGIEDAAELERYARERASE
jgi:hypothetical protein